MERVAKNLAPQAVEQAQSGSTLPAPSYADDLDPLLVKLLLQKLSQ